ncbi:MAG: hypothetical protein ACO4B4_06930 [Planctomycetota bacterium]
MLKPRLSLALPLALALPLLLLLGVTAPVGAQPMNDTCATALPIVCGDVVFGSTTTASPEALPFCGTSDGTAGAVWYRFAGTGDIVTLNTCQPGTTYDTKIRVYTGTCGNFTCVTGNDDVSCSPVYRSEVEFTTIPGVDYHVVVHGYSAASGDFEMLVTCPPPPAPGPNDLCVNATVIGQGAVNGSTLANDPDGESSCGGSVPSPSVWYRFVATEDLTLRARTCTADFDTVVSIHSGCPGDLFTELACSDDACGSGSVASVAATTGVEYWIRVSGAGGAAGDFTLEVDLFDPSQVIGPDVVYTDCVSISNWGELGGIRAYSLGSYTCNIGDENLAWGGNTPLLGMNAYRLSDGRLTQIGMSWMKRGTGAAVGNGCGLTCNGQGGSVLGVGCRDVYGSGFNGSQSILGPRSQVNAFTGDNPGSSGASPTILSKRLQVAEADLAGAGDLHFVEGVYVAPDDALAGNAWNNASYKRVTVSLPGYDLDPVGFMELYSPAIEAWRDHGNGVDTVDDSVELTTADIPGEGRFHVASKVTDLGGGLYLYDYAVFNLNSHRSAGSLTIPLPNGASVSGIGFHDVDHHSGEPYDPTDWGVSVGASDITWSSPQTFAQNEDSNALRFGTMYNFWFESDAAPGVVDATIGIFRPGTPDAIAVTVQGPAVPVVPLELFRRADCNDDGGHDISDPIFLLSHLFPGSATPPTLACPDACDGNDDGDLDIADAVFQLNWLFGAGAPPAPPIAACGEDPTSDGLACPGSGACP